MKRVIRFIRELFGGTPAGRLLKRAQSCFAAGNFAQAISDASDALECDPKLAPAYLLRAEAKIRRADFNGALFDLNRYVTIAEHPASGYILRGEAREGLHDLEGAIDDYSKAYELDPHAVDALCRRAAVRQKLELYSEALADYDKALAGSPSDRRAALSARATVKEELGDPKGAIADYAEASYLDARARQERRDFTGAVRVFTEALDYDPACARAYLGRAQCRSHLGDSAGAADDYEAAATLDPELLPEIPRQ